MCCTTLSDRACCFRMPDTRLDTPGVGEHACQLRLYRFQQSKQGNFPAFLFQAKRAVRKPNRSALRLVRLDHFSLIAYPLSGGFRSWSLLPELLVTPLLRLEALVAPLVGRFAGFRLLAVLERRS